jgi:hypothetical protein
VGFPELTVPLMLSSDLLLGLVAVLNIESIGDPISNRGAVNLYLPLLSQFLFGLSIYIYILDMGW